MATKLTPLQQAEAEYKARQKALDQGQLDAIDLPTLFESAAKQANPNYGLSRVELLAKYNAPEYSDTNSSNYIDPTTRIAMADRLASGYQGVLGQATDRASAIFGRDLSAKEQAANSAKERFGTLQAEDTRQRTRAEALADYEKQKQIDRRYSTSGGGGLTDLQLLGLQNSNPLGLAQLKGYTRELAPNGGKGYWFYRNNPDGTRTPVTVDEVANSIGGNRAALLEGSTNAGDQALIKSSAGKPSLSAAAQKDVNSINDALNVLDQIDSTSQKINTSSGINARIKGPLLFGQGLTGSNADVTRFNTNIGYLSRVVRAMGEVGALNEGDIKRATTLIPKLTDTAQEAQNKIRDLRTILNKNKALRENSAGADPTLQEVVDTGI